MPVHNPFEPLADNVIEQLLPTVEQHYQSLIRCFVGAASFVDLKDAKKWGDTEIAERGRSVLVMRARYRSAGLTPHQRGWTDAG